MPLMMAVHLRLRHLKGIRIENLDLEVTSGKQDDPRDSLTISTELLDVEHSASSGRPRTISQSSTASTIRPPNRRQTLSGDERHGQITEEALSASTDLQETPAPRSPVLQRTTSSGPQRRPTHLTHRSRSRLVIPREVELPDEAESPLLAKFRDLAFNPSAPTGRLEEHGRPRSISVSASASHLLGPTNVVAHHEEIHPRRGRAGSNASLLLPPPSVVNSPEPVKETLEPSEDRPPTTDLSIQRRLARCFVTLSQLSDVVRAATSTDLCPKDATRSQSLDSARGLNGQAEAHISKTHSRSTADVLSAPMRRISSASSADSTSTSGSSPGSPGSANKRGPAGLDSLAARRHSLTSSSRSKGMLVNGGQKLVPLNGKATTSAKGKLRKSSPLSTATDNAKPTDQPSPPPSVPFFLSPIHPASTHPAFATLTARDDFAEWLTDGALADDGCSVDVWIDAEPNGETTEENGWARFKACCHRVRFSDLLPLSNQQVSLFRLA